VVIIPSLLLFLNFIILLLHKLPGSTSSEELKDWEHQLYILAHRSNGLKVLKTSIDYALGLELSADRGPMSDLLELGGRLKCLRRSFPDCIDEKRRQSL
jgi:hypothetical protein